jgi:zinc protease
MLAAALLAPPIDQATEAALRIADQVLGGGFASRINMNLRENKHWTYGAQARLFDLRGPRPYVMQAAVQADKTGEAMKELHAELRAIVSSRRVTNAEVAPLQHAEAARLAAMTESIGGLANAVEHLVRHDLPDSHWSGYAEQLLALDAGAVNVAMQRLVDPKRLTWVVVGDRARIDDQLLATGLGSLEAL